MRRLSFLIGCILVASPVGAAYDANGVALGESEKRILKQFPSAHCKPLEWASRAADRRCDEARVSFGGIEAHVTFYLRGGKVQAFDVRFDARDAERMAAFLKQRYGRPVSETRDNVASAGKAPREIYKVRWENAAGEERHRALMTAQMDRRRALLSVSRGNFEEEIYRVR
jgi:hypothetical protein